LDDDDNNDSDAYDDDDDDDDDFDDNSGGPLPEELLPNVQCPVSMLWGQNDPWEPIDTGKAIG
jgi:pimeloyl-ACP methyl ester carboxylesterase